MATIKSYTDIEQSKKLAEILSVDSVDMLWGYYYNGKNHCIPNIRPFRDQRNEIPKGYIPAWSLAALLGVLKNYTLQTNTDGTVFVVCESKKPMISDAYDNPIDACVAMIEELHELKMI